MARVRRPDIDELNSSMEQLIEILNDGDDLSCVLVTTSYLDAALASLAGRFMIESSVSEALLEHDGRLGTLAGRAQIAYALALIPKPVYKNLSLIGQIRNLFAHHHLVLDFDDEAVTRLASQFVMPRVRPMHGSDATEADIPEDPWKNMVTARPRFLLVAAGTLLRLLEMARTVERRDVSTEMW